MIARDEIAHLGWIAGVLAALTTVLSLLGLLPWATRAELTQYKAETSATLSRIDQGVARIDARVDAIYRVLSASRSRGQGDGEAQAR